MTARRKRFHGRPVDLVPFMWKKDPADTRLTRRNRGVAQAAVRRHAATPRARAAREIREPPGGGPAARARRCCEEGGETSRAGTRWAEEPGEGSGERSRRGSTPRTLDAQEGERGRTKEAGAGGDHGGRDRRGEHP